VRRRVSERPALALASVGDTVPKAKIGTAMGLLGTMSASGTALGPSLGGVLLSAVGWQAVFPVNVPLGYWLLFSRTVTCLRTARRPSLTLEVSTESARCCLL
jgi:MFS family permease